MKYVFSKLKRRPHTLVNITNKELSSLLHLRHFLDEYTHPKHLFTKFIL